MSLTINLTPDSLKALREINPMMMSYNVEFAEVTGGTFWKAYTPEQIAGTEDFYVEPTSEGIAAMYKDLMQQCFDLIKPEYLNGWMIVNGIFGNIAKDLGYKYEFKPGVKSIFNRFSKEFVQ